MFSQQSFDTLDCSCDSRQLLAKPNHALQVAARCSRGITLVAVSQLPTGPFPPRSVASLFVRNHCPKWPTLPVQCPPHAPDTDSSLRLRLGPQTLLALGEGFVASSPVWRHALGFDPTSCCVRIGIGSAKKCCSAGLDFHFLGGGMSLRQSIFQVCARLSLLDHFNGVSLLHMHDLKSLTTVYA